MSAKEDIFDVGFGYIGQNDCKIASCTQKQEFPKADDPYCMGHSFVKWKRENDR